jgi:hypothetical protein
LLEILRQLESRSGVDYELCLLGQSFRHSPVEFEQIQSEFEHRLVQVGYETTVQRYHCWLQRADVVLSTAIHEFQGLAVLEAISAACIPVLPSRLVYTDLVPPAYLYESALDSPAREAASAVDLLLSIAQGDWDAPDVSQYDWSQQKPLWQRALQIAELQ